MPVLLNEEKDIISWTVDETDVGLRVPPFSADEERDNPSSASDSLAFRIAELLQQLDGEVDDDGLLTGCWRRLHYHIKEVDEFGIAARQYILCLLRTQDLL